MGLIGRCLANFNADVVLSIGSALQEGALNLEEAEVARASWNGSFQLAFRRMNSLDLQVWQVICVDYCYGLSDRGSEPSESSLVC